MVLNLRHTTHLLCVLGADRLPRETLSALACHWVKVSVDKASLLSTSLQSLPPPLNIRITWVLVLSPLFFVYIFSQYRYIYFGGFKFSLYASDFPYISVQPRFLFIPHTWISRYFLEVCPLDVTQISQSGTPDPPARCLSPHCSPSQLMTVPAPRNETKKLGWHTGQSLIYPHPSDSLSSCVYSSSRIKLESNLF